jgi:hypothetical protein
MVEEQTKQETIMKKAVSRALLVLFLFDIMFDPDYGGDMFL